MKRKQRAVKPAIERIMAHRKIAPGPLDTDCWLSTYSPDRRGSHITIDGACFQVHRVAYEMLVGPIPEGLEVVRFCHDQRCFRPEHMRAMTSAERFRWSNHPVAQVLRSNKCLNGHSMDDAYKRKDGKRNCRRCEADRHKERRQRISEISS